MSSEVAIQLAGVSKAYQIYSRPIDRLKQMLWRGRRTYYREFWALRGVTLDIYRGETVGIVGRNGSGKSTLLQTICGTLQPTQGTITVNGRVAALLELGSGFNPEFTGRENVFMNAAILGLSDAEIDRRFDNIAAFADIGAFIEQPVKSYSSGMYARLAFAVAINVDPDILVVDEILAVGDEAFRRKCFARIEQIRDCGSTILFVSHSAGNIIELCDRAVLMDRGQRVLTGRPKIVMSRYQRLSYAPAEEADAIRDEIQRLDRGEEPADVDSTSGQSSSVSSFSDSVDGARLSRLHSDSTDRSLLGQASHPADAAASLISSPAILTNADSGKLDNSGQFDPHLKPKSTVSYVSQGAEIVNAHIANDAGRLVNILQARHLYDYVYTVRFDRDATHVRAGMLLKTLNGVELGGLMSHPSGDSLDYVSAGTELTVKFRFYTCLNPGTYFLNAGVTGWLDGREAHLHRLLDAVMFRVEPIPQSRVTGRIDFSGGGDQPGYNLATIEIRSIDGYETQSFSYPSSQV